MILDVSRGDIYILVKVRGRPVKEMSKPWT